MQDYKRYRWFYTSNNVLVVGGKNAAQNDELLLKMIDNKKFASYVVMHTSSPGSPFSILIKDPKKLSSQDLEECAVFTACFSKAWKERKKEALIDIFTLGQLSKDKTMKSGMWRVTGTVQRKKVTLEVGLIKQKGILRAVPLVKKQEYLLKLAPGSVDKDTMALTLEVELGHDFSHEEIMGALPAGGMRKNV